MANKEKWGGAVLTGRFPFLKPVAMNQWKVFRQARLAAVTVSAKISYDWPLAWSETRPSESFTESLGGGIRTRKFVFPQAIEVQNFKTTVNKFAPS